MCIDGWIAHWGAHKMPNSAGKGYLNSGISPLRSACLCNWYRFAFFLFMQWNGDHQAAVGLYTLSNRWCERMAQSGQPGDFTLRFLLWPWVTPALWYWWTHLWNRGGTDWVWLSSRQPAVTLWPWRVPLSFTRLCPVSSVNLGKRRLWIRRGEKEQRT